MCAKQTESPDHNPWMGARIGYQTAGSPLPGYQLARIGPRLAANSRVAMTLLARLKNILVFGTWSGLLPVSG